MRELILTSAERQEFPHRDGRLELKNRYTDSVVVVNDFTNDSCLHFLYELFCSLLRDLLDHALFTRDVFHFPLHGAFFCTRLVASGLGRHKQNGKEVSNATLLFPRVARRSFLACRSRRGTLLISMVNPDIFRAYDIRGKAHVQLSTEACHLIGQAFGSVLRRMYAKDRPEVVVGRDARTHGPELEAAVIQGLMKSGCHVHAIGRTPSPVNYFTICEKKLDGGIQVTASHNLKEDNGLKLQIREAEAYSGMALQALRRQIERGDFLEGKGSMESLDATGPYEHFLTDLFSNAAKDLTIIVDGGNGVAGPVNCAVLKACGAKVIELYTEPDGEFPNHPADPSRHETLKDLQVKMKQEHADVGLAFDGDGDRLGIVDERGTIWSSDHVLLLLSKDHLSRHPGAPVIFTVSNSSLLETEITKWGGKPVMSKVGHSFVEHAIREQSALLGGEQSGHFFCGEDYYGFDDALVAAVRFLSIVKGKKLSAVMGAFPKVYQLPELRPSCPDDAKGKVIAAITGYFAKTFPVNTLDGARIDFGDGAWAGIRQSNTSPCISICMEARSPEKLEEVKDMMMNHLRNYPEVNYAL